MKIIFSKGRHSLHGMHATDNTSPFVSSPQYFVSRFNPLSRSLCTLFSSSVSTTVFALQDGPTDNINWWIKVMMCLYSFVWPVRTCASPCSYSARWLRRRKPPARLAPRWSRRRESRRPRAPSGRPPRSSGTPLQRCSSDIYRYPSTLHFIIK